MNKRVFKYIKFILCSLVLVIIDQYTKFAVVDKIGKTETHVVIKKLLSFQYVENTGVAFGILSGKSVFIIIFAIIISLIICYLIHQIESAILNNKENSTINYKSFKKKFTFIQIILVFVISGSIGNLIDRIRYGYVVDFLKFEFIDFPVFNVADCYVTISAVVLLVTLIFFIKENELELVKFRK